MSSASSVASSFASHTTPPLPDSLALSLCIRKIEQLISQIDLSVLASPAEPKQNVHKYLQLSEDERHLWRKLHMSLGLIEKTPMQAMDMLQTSGLEDNTLAALRLGLELYDNSSIETVEKIFAAAADLELGVENRIFLCEQVVAIDPYHFEAYKLLISLTTDKNKKMELLEIAAENAYAYGETILEGEFREELEDLQLYVANNSAAVTE